jgi:carbon-monoxide dehydrogenase medium subunit
VTRHEFHQPRSWDEAINLLANLGPEAKPLAGGTDLMIQMHRSLISPKHLVSLVNIPDWRYIQINGDVRLGAGVTFRQIEQASELPDEFKALKEAACQVGGVQVRNVATLAGNLGNASPAADSAPPLMVLDARCTIRSPDGERNAAISDLFLGPGETTLDSAELITEVLIPAPSGYSGSIFLKAGRRKAMELSIVGVAVRLTLEPETHRCEEARIALGAVAPTPIRIEEAEQILEGDVVSEANILRASQIVTDTIKPITDVRASADFRRYLAGEMVKKGLRDCIVVRNSKVKSI